MFESIVIREVNRRGSIDLGLLAEVILFYGQVHLLIDRSMLTGLTKELGSKTILRMLRSGYVRGTYIRAGGISH